MNMLTQIQCPPDLDLAGLEQFINDQESPLVRFNNISESGHSPAPNILTLSISDTPATLACIVLKQVPPDLDANAAGELIDSLIDQGFQPDGDHFYDVNVAGGEITVIPFRKEALPDLKPDSEGTIKTMATVFGLNMDGSIDAEDNGVGSPFLG